MKRPRFEMKTFPLISIHAFVALPPLTSCSLTLSQSEMYEPDADSRELMKITYRFAPGEDIRV